ncbi:MAG: type IV pilus twitching motility protein PilT [Mycobacteriales bacterium]|nr:type IV pilus twitching motility protein PilT [Mycobacteriales bacterium]
MDQHSQAGGMDGFFASTPPAPSPLDPQWQAAPQMEAHDPLGAASSGSVSFDLDAPVAAPTATLSMPLAPAAVPLVAAPAVAAPAPSWEPPAYVPAQAAEEVVEYEEVEEDEDLPVDRGLVRIGAEDSSDDSAFLADLLVHVIDAGCSDLHVTVGAPPTVRKSGSLVAVEDYAVLTPQVVQKTLYAIMSQKQREKFESELELDFAYSLPGRARFRVNVYKQRDAMGAAFRLIPYEIKALEDLGVPPSISNLAMLPRGFVLVTGPTGSGKSTTLAAVVDLANRQRNDHIMTVEDPIEFLHQHKNCLVNQREVGEDTWSFKNALKHVLRQDPDIILVGEMRDLETIEIALTAAETGHLVMATLHTQDAAQTIDRVIDVFPPSQQQQVRVMLSGALQGVVCQQLVKTADGKGRVVATEVMIATPAIRNLIREGKTHQIYSALQAGAKHGMQTMDSSLATLVRQGKITYDAALEKCHHVEDFNRLCGR